MLQILRQGTSRPSLFNDDVEEGNSHLEERARERLRSSILEDRGMVQQVEAMARVRKLLDQITGESYSNEDASLLEEELAKSSEDLATGRISLKDFERRLMEATELFRPERRTSFLPSTDNALDGPGHEASPEEAKKDEGLEHLRPAEEKEEKEGQETAKPRKVGEEDAGHNAVF